ncbi:MAG: uracil-DNA glycosylase family protein [Myxococcota bacterium]|nr:uracil-DNA glycosylase family protein [Myxococcota bacterium]
MSHADRVIRAARDLRTAVDALAFAAPVTHVYNPLGYAWRGQRAYLKRFSNSKKRVVFLGMNPGPFGMSQTGVPFGEVALVRDFVGIEERIDPPPNEHPKRPVQGFACTRSEVSGSRLWGAIQSHWKTPERFFAKHFIANYCPLVFMEESGRNRTPDKLPATERAPLYAACDRHLERVVSILEPEWVIGIGAFAAKRASEVLGDRVQIGTILHPSPANPRANRNWEGEVRTQLRDLGLCGTRRRAS